MTSRTQVPEALDSLELLAAARRAEVAENYLSGKEVRCRLGITAETLKDWQKERRVLAVWHDPVQAWLYPDFQFDGNGLIKQMPELLAVYDRYYSHVWQNTWTIVEWFLSCHALLDGRRPMEVMAQNPQSVLRVAQIEFWADPATLW